MSDAGDDTVHTLPDSPVPPESTGTPGSVYVLGTAHVSKASVDEVHETVADRKPDIVAVELDESRYRQMQGETPDDIEATDLLSGNTVFQFLAYWMLSYVQSRLGERFDIEPGADMRAAIEAAEAGGHGVALVDRDIQVTIQRFWSRLSVTEKLKMIGGLALGVTDPRTIGVAFGAVLGIFGGALFGLVIAPLIGIDPLVVLGLTGSLLQQYIGAVGVGIVGGFLLGLLLLPSLDAQVTYAGGRIGETTLRLLGGIAIGVTACLLAVWSGTFVGPFSAGTFEGAGSMTIRGSAGILAGLGIGVGVGLVIGILLEIRSPEVDAIDEFDIERMTDGDVVAAMMEEFRRFSPRGANALIDERDAYIARNLHALSKQGFDVVAVVGAGHKAGIERYLENPESLPPIESISGTTSRRWFSPIKVIGYLVMIAFVGFFFLLIMAGVQNTFLLQLFLAWFLFNGIFAFSLARLAGARWISAGVGGCVAWLTSINPLLAPGWFAGYVELKYRPVNVSDISTLNEIAGDTDRPINEALGDMLDVPLFRLIMIVALTNVGSMIATFTFPVVVLPWLAPEIGGIDALMGELLRGAENSLELIRGLLP